MSQYIRIIIKTIKILFRVVWFPFYIIGVGLIKPILIRYWARELTKKIYNIEHKKNCKNEVKNICGIGGQLTPIFRSWVDIYNDNHTINPLDSSKYVLKPAAIEQIFFGYFGPLEAWCEQNFTGDFALWTDQKGIYLLLVHDYDRTYFSLKWGKNLPNFNSLEDEFIS